MPIESLKWLFAPAPLLMGGAAAVGRYRSGTPVRIWRLLGSALLFELLGRHRRAGIEHSPGEFPRDPKPFQLLVLLMAAS